VRLSGKTPHVRIVGKGDRERHVPVVNSTRDLLALWLEKRPKGTRWLLPVIQNGTRTFGKARPGRPVSQRSVRQMVAHYADKVLGRHVRPHELRHTAGTNWYRKTRNLRAVQDLLGHADISTTQIYTHVGGADLVDVMKAVDPDGDQGDDVTAIAAKLAALPADVRAKLRDIL
jgi:site-specific recombinase XerC